MRLPEVGAEVRYLSAGYAYLATVVRVVHVAGRVRGVRDFVLCKNQVGRLLTFDLDDVYTDEHGRWTVALKRKGHE